MVYLEILEKAFTIYKKYFAKIIVFLILYFFLFGVSLLLIAIPFIILLSLNLPIALFYLIIALLAGVLIYSFLESSFYSLITFCAQNKDFCISEVFKNGKRKMFSFLGATIISTLIIAIPLILFVGSIIISGIPYLPSNTLTYISNHLNFSISSFYSNYFHIIMFIFFFSIIALFYLKYRLFFYTPFLFLKDNDAISSIKNSFYLTSKELEKSLTFFIVLSILGSVLGLLTRMHILGLIISLLFTFPYLRLAIFIGFIKLFPKSSKRSISNSKKIKKAKKTKTKRKR